MTQYMPELGQAAFGQPFHEIAAGAYIEAALNAIRHDLDRVMWNREQKEYDSPFGNTGNSFSNDTFEAIAYSWSDDEQPYNFAWRDVRISWYKYLGRGMSMNRAVTPDEAAGMLDDCLASLRAFDEETQARLRGPQDPAEPPGMEEAR